MLKLHDYQAEIKARLYDSWSTNRSVMVQMPTGTGKTYLLASVVSDFILSGQGISGQGAVWIVAHRRELVAQIEGTLERWRQRLCKERQGSLPWNVRAMSVQWLSRHYDDLPEKPGLIVVDEAHHALAETYREMWERFPKAKFLGLTATPCRLDGSGFMDLFDCLVPAWEIAEFIGKGYLSLYDFASIKPGSVTRKLVSGLRKRGADGDYQQKEMDAVLNSHQSIECLYRSYTEYANGRKGIVYAINIAHAGKIAEYYRKHGVAAVAIDSRTPMRERQRLIAEFRNSGQGSVRVLVNVDIFSEGFDCPDVEFIQLARPTLSLAKYLQMVGRGLRTSVGKGCCIILDNVGLYHTFGLPSHPHDWERMFRGKRAEYAMDYVLETACNHSSTADFSGGALDGSEDSEMMMVVTHERLPQVFAHERKDAELILRRERLLDGDYGTVRKLGHWLVKLIDREGRRWCVDLRNMHRLPLREGEAFPKVQKIGGVEFVRYRSHIYTRTYKALHKEYFKGCVEDCGFYSLARNMKVHHACRRFYGREIRKGSAKVCFLHSDPMENYWLSGVLADGSIIVMDGNECYYHVAENALKVYFAENNPVSERESIDIRLPEMIETAEQNVRNRKENELRCEDVPLVVEPFLSGRKWGLRKRGGMVVVPPVNRMILAEQHGLFAFERNANRWGVMDGKGAVVVDAQYEDVEIESRNAVIVSLVTGERRRILLE